jgi:hypothetical protein
MINMLKATQELDKVTQYKMTLDKGIKKMSEMAGEIIDVAKVAFFEDIRENKDPVKICSVMDIDGVVYATNSSTFMEDLENISDLFTEGEKYAIKVEKGISKSGREYIYCSLV